MDTKKILEHTCFQRDNPLSPVGCRCRKYITTVEAAKLITQGSAQFVVKGYKTASIEEDCPLCAGQEKRVRSCVMCKRTGKVTVNKKMEIYGDDIIITIGSKGKRLANATAKKTPRSPTIEQGHIERLVGAIGNSTQAASNRIDEYEMLTLKERLRLLVVNYNLEAFEIAWALWVLDPACEFPMKLRLEPVDDAKTHTGRRYDFGRSV
jgi:hypothetical protein